MAVGWIKDTLTWANDQPLAEDFRFWSDRAKTVPAPIADASAWLNQRDGDDGVEMTTANGRILVAGGVVGLRVSAEDMQTLEGGAEGAVKYYDLEVRATDANGGVRQVRGTVGLIAGLAE